VDEKKQQSSLSGNDARPAIEHEQAISELAYKLMLTLHEAALLSGLSRGFLRSAIRDGRLKGRVLGRGYKVKRADLDDFLRRLTSAAGPADEPLGAASHVSGDEEGANLLETVWQSEVPPPDLTHGNTTFRLKGHAGAQVVALAGSFNDWDPAQIIFAREGDEWVSRIDLLPGRHAYKFVVDGEWMIDPDNPHAEGDGRGNINSVLTKAPS
jgi:excisionase family DNA binding protein